MKNTVRCGVTSQLCDSVLLVAAYVQMFRYIYLPLQIKFAINSVIVVAISHTLNAVYFKSN